uniref:hypothetical protein n=1 Tax=Pseudomonas sp. TaxID=306 RepID=UPI0010B9C994|nr:hypothetical protein [Pseudomonas sp.]QBM91771.1 partitioning protein ParB [Pseudomonas sp.]
MALEGLTKQANVAVDDPSVDAFINAAKVQDGPRAKQSKARAKRVNFSLTDEVDGIINDLSLKPRTFQASRSDVVKAAVALLASHSDSEIIELIKRSTQQ